MSIARYQELLLEALSYAKRGWKVFPVHTIAGAGCTCYKHLECGAIAKHPAVVGWREKATGDESQIREWWHDRKRGYNVGIVTGSVSDLVVIDVDDKHGKCGSETLAALGRENNWTPSTLSVTTGSGRHYYFRYPGMPVKTSVQCLGEGVDVKGEGGYVVAPPSTHASYREYGWDDRSASVEPLPEWLIARLLSDVRAPHSSKPVPRSETAADAGSAQGMRYTIQQGARNTTLFRRACAMRAKGYGPALIEAELVRDNARYCQPPLPAAEVRQIVEGSSRYGSR